MKLEELKQKKIAMMYGQSIEGCGVTRNGSEMQIWCDRNGVEFKVFSYDERKYNRRKAHVLNYTSFMKEDIPSIVEELNKYDVVIFQSYPSNKFSDTAINDFYKNLVKKVTTLKVGFMHEVNKTNVDKIPYIVPIMNEMDLIFNFSERTWFSQELNKVFPSKELGKRINRFTLWLNFEELEKYRHQYPLEEKAKKAVYCSRWTTMKGPARLLDMAEIFKELGSEITCELKGIERSIGAKADIFDHKNAIDRTGKTINENETGLVPVYGPYEREEGMEFMAKNLFYCSFFRLPKDPEGYGNRMEYTQIEAIGVGSIPVFDKHFGEHNTTKDGRRYVDIPYLAIFSDKDNLKDTCDQIIKVANDVELQKKYVETSYQIAKEEFDANWVLLELFDHIFTVGKDENKFKTDEELLKHLSNNNEEFVKDALDILDGDQVLVAGFRELASDPYIYLAVIDVKKEKVIKKFKRNKK